MQQVEDLLDKNKIDFTRRGSDLLVKCLNPEHDDTNPSMRINNVTGIFHCFSCGFKGNLFKHFGEKPVGIEMLRLSLASSIEKAEMENVGLRIPKDHVPFSEDYRGISPKTYIKFKAFTHEEEFPARIMFPIYDILGNIVAFHGRHKDTYGKPKYLNFPRHTRLPFYPAKPKTINNNIILVEGIFDMINLHDKGLDNAVCCFGTDNFTQEDVNRVKMLGISSVTIFFDDDEKADGKNPGQTAAAKLKELFENNGIFTQNVTIKGSDPGSLSKKQVLNLRDQLYG